MVKTSTQYTVPYYKPKKKRLRKIFKTRNKMLFPFNLETQNSSH